MFNRGGAKLLRVSGLAGDDWRGTISVGPNVSGAEERDSRAVYEQGLTGWVTALSEREEVSSLRDLLVGSIPN